MSKRLSLITLLLVAVLALRGSAGAQDEDPPSRVARISYVSGPVSFEPASVDSWSNASLNYPVTTGDGLYTDEGGLAVLRIGQNSLRLNSRTNFQFVNLSDDVVQASVNSGALNVRIRHLFPGESWEIDTPNGAISIGQPGLYRVDTDPDRNATMVTVRAGYAEVMASDQSFPISAGQSAYFDNSGNAPEIQGAIQSDDFDGFADSRDRVEDVPPPPYVSPDMVGYEDLNANGDWVTSSPYGPMWLPRVAAGWTPYHQGYWSWVDPWGWTWVDDEPWGFAPFHYGRWAYLRGRWGWCPGATAERVYYAPALVAFVGGGFGAGGDAVGWFPLGPREPYIPTYQVSEAYVRHVNVTNTTITNINITNINVTRINYVNRNAVVAVPRNSFTTAQPVQRAALRVDPNQIRQAQVIGTAPKIAPRVESVAPARSGRQAAAPPASIVSRAVVAKLKPPPAPVPFAARQQELLAHPGTPIPSAQMRSSRTRSAAPQPVSRTQVQPINIGQVHKVTPTVRPGPARTFAQRPPSGPPQAARPATNVLRPQQNPPMEEPAHPSPPEVQPMVNNPQPSDRNQVRPEMNRGQVQPQNSPPARPAQPQYQQPQPAPNPQVPARERAQPQEMRPPVRQPQYQQPQPAPNPQAPAREQVQPQEMRPPVRQPQFQQPQPAPNPQVPARERAQPQEMRPPVRQPQYQQPQPPPKPQPPQREQVQPPPREQPTPRANPPQAHPPAPPNKPSPPKKPDEKKDGRPEDQRH